MTLERIWPLLPRRADRSRVAEALLGVSPAAARSLGGAFVAASGEADDLLDNLPRIFRALAGNLVDVPDRLHGEIRGPILWSETFGARGNVGGDPMVFVCAIPQRAYNTAENRVLVAALQAVHGSANAISRHQRTGMVRHARANGTRALRALEHHALVSVPRNVTPSARDRLRTARHVRRRAFHPALRVLERAADPLPPSTLELLADDRSVAQWAMFEEVVVFLHERGHAVGGVRVESGALVAGPVTFVHARGAGSRHRSPGIHVGDLHFDLPPERTPRGRVRRSLAPDERPAPRSHAPEPIYARDPAEAIALVTAAGY